MSTLVLNLDDTLASRLATAAAHHGKALPDWAAEQLARVVGAPAGTVTDAPGEAPARDRMREALGSLTGIWKDRGTTDELMHLTRGED